MKESSVSSQLSQLGGQGLLSVSKIPSKSLSPVAPVASVVAVQSVLNTQLFPVVAPPRLAKDFGLGSTLAMEMETQPHSPYSSLPQQIQIPSSVYLSAIRTVFNNNSKKHGENGIPQFLIKTYRMLENCTENPFDKELLCWSKHGNSFVIKEPELFARDIIPRYFSHNNFQSFVRQLNFYGFHKVNTVGGLKETKIREKKKSKNRIGEKCKVFEFKHKRFVRGKLHLLNQIKRTTSGLEKHNIAAEKELKELRSIKNDLEGQIQNLQSAIESLNKEKIHLTETNASQVMTILHLQETNKKLNIQNDMLKKSSQQNQNYNYSHNLGSLAPGQIINFNHSKHYPNEIASTTNSVRRTALSYSSPTLEQGSISSCFPVFLYNNINDADNSNVSRNNDVTNCLFVSEFNESMSPLSHSNGNNNRTIMQDFFPQQTDFNSSTFSLDLS